MWIMIAGPYRSGSDNPDVWKKNLEEMNRAALTLFRRGHVPVIGVNLGLPIIEAAGEEEYGNLMMPLSLALAERCDAVLRIGGPSAGADREVESFRLRNLPVYTSVDMIPRATSADSQQN